MAMIMRPDVNGEPRRLAALAQTIGSAFHFDVTQATRKR
jgi:hypothetical protein